MKNQIITGIVFTVTTQHCGCEKEIYQFFSNLQKIYRRRIGVKLNPVYPAGKGRQNSSRALIISAKEYGEFLLKIWHLRNNDPYPFPLSPLDDWFGKNGISCEFSGSCQDSFISMDSIGNIYTCGRFCDEKKSLGNLMESSLEELLNHDLRKNLAQRSAKLYQSSCKDCQMWDACHGGCPFYAYLYYGDVMEPTPFCETYHYLYEKTGGEIRNGFIS
jgi:uncharacterized protein